MRQIVGPSGTCPESTMLGSETCFLELFSNGDRSRTSGGSFEEYFRPNDPEISAEKSVDPGLLGFVLGLFLTFGRCRASEGGKAADWAAKGSPYMPPGVYLGTLPLGQVDVQRQSSETITVLGLKS